MSEQKSLSPEDILTVNAVDPGSRLKLLNQGDLLHPGACAVCGSGNYQEGYLSLDLFIDFFGDVYLCLQCLSEGASAAGMLSKEQSEHVKELLSELSTENKTLKGFLKEASERIAIYERAFSAAGVNVNAVNGSVVSDGSEPVDEDSETVVEDVDTITEPEGTGEPEPDEPVTSDESGGTSGTTGTDSIKSRAGRKPTTTLKPNI